MLEFHQALTSFKVALPILLVLTWHILGESMFLYLVASK